MTPSIARLSSGYHALNPALISTVAPETAERIVFDMLVKHAIGVYWRTSHAIDIGSSAYATAKANLRRIARDFSRLESVADKARLRTLQLYLVGSLDDLAQLYDGVLFDRYAQRLNSLLPYQDIAALARRTGLHSLDRAELARVAFARAYALGQHADVVSLLPLVAATNPPLREFVERIQGVISKRHRQQLIVLLILRNPGFNLTLNDASPDRVQSEREHWRDHEWYMRRPEEDRPVSKISPYRNLRNWWCATQPPWSATEHAMEDLTALLRLPEAWGRFHTVKGMTLGVAERALRSGVAANLHTRFLAKLMVKKFLDESLYMHRADWGQLQALSKVDSAPKMLSRAIIAWAENSNLLTWAFGSDRDLPEALHRAVVSTRYGCKRRVKHGN